MAAASPSLILLTGQNYLRAGAAGVNLDGGSALSVAVVFDPHLLGSDQDGTIVAKHNPGDSQFGWVLSYNSVTGFVTATIYDDAAGSNSISRVSTIELTRRSVVAFTFNLTPGDIHLFVDGVNADGTQTGSITTIASNTERLAFFADSTNNVAQNPCKGGLYYVAIWRVTLTGGEVATIQPDGLTPGPLSGGGYSLVANFIAPNIQQDPDGHFGAWVDTVASLTMTGFAVAGATPYCNLEGPGLLLLTNAWDYSLVDTGNPGGSGLTSTYSVAPPFRLWAPAATEPQRATGYRQHLNDITVLIRARKVIGTTQAVLIRLHSLLLEYDLASEEMFLILGDDITATNQNQRISFGFGLFPIEGVTADIVLRVNAADKTADLFIGGTMYSQSIAATNANETTDGIFFATNTDFVLASVVPACLSDAAVAQLIAGNQSNAYSIGFEPIHLGYISYLTIAYPLIDVLGDVPVAVDPDLIPYIVAQFWSPGLESIHLGYTNSPYPVIDSAKNLFQDPNPVIDSVTVDTNHHVTGLASAGPTDAYLTYSYWEIELDPGVSIIVIDKEVSTQFFAGRTQITNYWDVPNGSLWNGLRIRFVIQAVDDSAQIWYSAWQTLNDPNFNNRSGGDSSVGTYTDPLSSVQSVSVDNLHNVTAVAMSGPILPAGSTATLHYWEVEMDTGAVFASGAMAVDGQISTSRVQIVDHFKVPVGEVWNCRRARFVVRIEDEAKRHPPLIFYSAWYRLQDPHFNNPGLPPAIAPIWPGAVNPVSDNPIIPPLSFDLFDVHEYTFGKRSDLFPLGTLVNFAITVDPSIGTPQFFDNGADLPAGLYTITYAAGARFNMTTSKWNDFLQGNFGTGSQGLWIQSGLNFPYYVMQSPAFIVGGYASQILAQNAAVGYSFIFYHLGGPLGVIFDLDDCSYTGSITLTLNDTQGTDIPGEWQIVNAPDNLGTAFVDPSQQFPTVRGLVRGQTHVRYIVKGDDNKARWQDAYIRVWPSPGATNQAQQLDPNAPAKPFPVDVKGSAKQILPRNSIIFPPPTSGNKA